MAAEERHLVDSSVWIDYLRAAPTRARDRMRELVAIPASLCTTEPIVMELLAGASDEAALDRLESLSAGLALLPVVAAVDYHQAAAIFREVRASGRTVRRLVDCLIAAVGIRTGVTLVHKDADFEAIAAVFHLPPSRSADRGPGSSAQMRPRASIASATVRKPATFAPLI